MIAVEYCFMEYVYGYSGENYQYYRLQILLFSACHIVIW